MDNREKEGLRERGIDGITDGQFEDEKLRDCETDLHFVQRDS